MGTLMSGQVESEGNLKAKFAANPLTLMTQYGEEKPIRTGGSRGQPNAP